MYRRAAVAVSALGLVLSLLGGRPAAASGFQDLSQVPWAAPAIDLVAGQGAMVGVSASRFDPEAAISRQEVAVILSRILALGTEASLLPFQDQAEVAPWARVAMAQAVAAGLIKGEGSLLAPDQAVSRAEAAVLLWRLAGSPTPLAAAPPFADQAQIPTWAAPAVSALTALGVVTGLPGHLFQPEAPVSRAAFALMLARVEPDLAAMPGLPRAVAGRVSQWIAPNQSTLAVQSGLAGPAGGVLLASGRVWPLGPGAAVWVGGQPADLYALAQGDPVSALLEADGNLGLVIDFGPGGLTPLTVENASMASLFLSDGTVWTVPASLSATLGQVTAPVLPSDLVGAVLAGPPSASAPLRLDQVTLPDLSGLVVRVGQNSLTVAVASSPSPFLTAGTWLVATTPKTAYQGPSGAASGPPPVGSTVSVLATLSGTGQLTAQVVAW